MVPAVHGVGVAWRRLAARREATGNPSYRSGDGIDRLGADESGGAEDGVDAVVNFPCANKHGTKWGRVRETGGAGAADG